METHELKTTLPEPATTWPREGDRSVQPDTDTSPTKIESLLLGLRLCGNLTPDYEELLRSMTDQSSFLFLHREGSFFNNREWQASVAEVVATALNSRCTAIFSHRFSVPDVARNNCHRVQAAVIDPQSEKPIVLGMVSPDPGFADSRTVCCFADLLSRFQTATIDIDRQASELESVFLSELPNIVINRASGRVLAANGAISTALGLDAASMSGIEFGQLKAEIADRLTTSAMHIENLRCGTLALATVTFRKLATKASRHQPSTNEFLIHQMRNAMTAIISAASCLDDSFHGDEQSEQNELTGILVREAIRLDKDLTRWSLLFDYSGLRNRPVIIEQELKRAIEFVQPAIKQDCRIDFMTSVGPTAASFPEKALMFLFEAVLTSHLKQSPSSRRTVIECGRDSQARIFKVRFETVPANPNEHLELDQRWLDVTGRLADVMGIRLHNGNSPQSSGLVTDLEIPQKTEKPI
jgi:hypothetical protein